MFFSVTDFDSYILVHEVGLNRLLKYCFIRIREYIFLLRNTIEPPWILKLYDKHPLSVICDGVCLTLRLLIRNRKPLGSAQIYKGNGFCLEFWVHLECVKYIWAPAVWMGQWLNMIELFVCVGFKRCQSSVITVISYGAAHLYSWKES